MSADRSAGRLADAQESPVRVMLVGRSGLDPVLRRDPGFEVYRPRGATDAIGELAEVSRLEDDDGMLVLVTEGCVESGRTAQFASAVRRIDAGARVLAVRADGPAPEGYDGVVHPGADAASIRALGRPSSAPVIESVIANPTRAASSPTSGIPASLTPQTPVRVEPKAPVHSAPVATNQVAVQAAAIQTTGSPAVPNVHERTPLGAILSGRDPVDAALESVRALHGGEIRYLAQAAGQEAPAGGVPVSYAGRVYGHLVASGVPTEAVVKEAAWLGGWVALAAQQEQLRRAAFTDELTGAWNRRYFQRFLNAAVDQARALRRTVSLLVFDIDNFKSYNDRYGHPAGDDILVESVRLLKGIVRPSDRVCRVGGDEFAVIFYDPEGPRNPGSPQSAGGLQSVAEIARRFRQQICEHRFPKLGDEAPGTLTISGGMATFPWDAQSPTELLERADALSLTSKRQGKNLITLGLGAEHRVDGGQHQG